MNRFLSAAVICLLLPMFFAGCGAPAQYSENTFYAMNTFVTVRLSVSDTNGTPLSKNRLAQIHKDCEDLVRAVENSISATVADSDTARFNASADGINNGGVFFTKLLTQSFSIAEATENAFHPALRPLSVLWDFGGEGYVPTSDEISDLLCHIDLSFVRMEGSAVYKSDPALQIDFGAIAKGYAAALVRDYLQTTECRGGLLSLGGNVALFGEKEDGSPYKVGLTDPFSSDRVLGYLHRTDGFVSVSGSYERYFEKDGVRYHHILDPRTGSPADSGLVSAAVIAQDGTLADALSTALFVMGVQDAIAFYECGVYDFEAILVTQDGRIIVTEGIAASFDCTASYTVQISSSEAET